MKARRGHIRPGGRTAQVRKEVVGAVLALLKAGKLDFEQKDVAKLSGIHRTTIYSRWPDRASLLREALAEHTSQLKIKLSGDWKKDLHRIGYSLRDFSAKPLEIAMNSLLALSPNSNKLSGAMNAHWAALTDTLSESLLSAQREGLVRKDIAPSLVISILMAIIVSNIVLAKHVPTDKEVDELVRHLIVTCTPSSDRPSKRR